MTRAGPNYDPRSALLAFAPGVLLTREIEAALMQRFVDNGGTPLTSDQVIAITGPLPPPVTSIKRLECH